MPNRADDFFILFGFEEDLNLTHKAGDGIALQLHYFLVLLTHVGRLRVMKGATTAGGAEQRCPRAGENMIEMPSRYRETGTACHVPSAKNDSQGPVAEKEAEDVWREVWGGCGLHHYQLPASGWRAILGERPDLPPSNQISRLSPPYRASSASFVVHLHLHHPHESIPPGPISGHRT